MNIPDTFRPPARARAERLLAAEPDEERQKRILNQISEEEWRLDRLEWHSWMDQMRRKFNRMEPEPTRKR